MIVKIVYKVDNIQKEKSVDCDTFDEGGNKIIAEENTAIILYGYIEEQYDKT